MFKAIAESRASLSHFSASSLPKLTRSSLADIIARVRPPPPAPAPHPPRVEQEALTLSLRPQQLQYGLKITFIFIAVLFADAVNQMLKIHREREACVPTSLSVSSLVLPAGSLTRPTLLLSLARSLATSPAGVAATPDMRAQADYRSRKFLSGASLASSLSFSCTSPNDTR